MARSTTPIVRRTWTVFLQVVVVLVGVGAAALLIREPQIEGRNAHATLFQTYFNDPFLAFVYLASLAFFAALYQAFRLLGYAGRGTMFSPRAVQALRRIKYCALGLIGFLGGAEIYFTVFRRDEDDIAGGVAVGLAMIFLCAVVATAAAVGERLLQRAVEIQAENDLTV